MKSEEILLSKNDQEVLRDHNNQKDERSLLNFFSEKETSASKYYHLTSLRKETGIEEIGREL